MSRWTELLADAAITLTVGAAVVLLGVRGVAAVLRLASDDPPETQRRAADRLRGGAWIGALERMAAYVAIVAHFPAGLAIILAVKGLARYPDLREHDAGVSERFIIGTFLSVLLAIAGGGLALWLTGLT